MFTAAQIANISPHQKIYLHTINNGKKKLNLYINYWSYNYFDQLFLVLPQKIKRLLITFCPVEC